MFRRSRMRGEVAADPAPSTAPVGCRYRMVQKLVARGDDFFVRDDRGQLVFKVDGKTTRVRGTLIFRDLRGNEVCKIQKRAVRVLDTMEVEESNGHRAAIVTKAMVTPVRDRFVVKVGDGPDLEVQGNILAHEYRIGNVATVSKKWFRLRNSYGVEVAPGQDDVLILATTVCIDQMTSDLA